MVDEESFVGFGLAGDSSSDSSSHDTSSVWFWVADRS
jgi:hypothetical protein